MVGSGLRGGHVTRRRALTASLPYCSEPSIPRLEASGSPKTVSWSDCERLALITSADDLLVIAVTYSGQFSCSGSTRVQSWGFLLGSLYSLSLCLSFSGHHGCTTSEREVFLPFFSSPSDFSNCRVCLFFSGVLKLQSKPFLNRDVKVIIFVPRAAEQ